MSSSTRPRPERRRATALALAAACAGLLCAGTAAATGLEVVAVVPAPADRSVDLVAGVQPAPESPLPPGAFTVTTGDTELPVTAVPVVSGELTAGLVLDTSAAGEAALQGGVNGVASFLLQLPDGVRTVLVTDGVPARVLVPDGPASEAVAAVSSVRAGGDRDTRAALAAALDRLPETRGRPRVLVLYTGAADAGGEPATDLAGRLRAAGVLLAVVATGEDQRYWSQVTADTGGVLVNGREQSTVAAFDQVARLLRGRYVLRVPAPEVLPATVTVTVAAPDGSATQTAEIPAYAGTRSRWPTGVWLVLLTLLVVALAAAGTVVLRRRSARPVQVVPPAPAPLPVAEPGPAVPPPPLPRRRPMPVPDPPAARQPPPDAAAMPLRTSAAVDRTAETDNLAYQRLDAVVGRAAAQVTQGRLDTAHAVARIAIAARGRLDLLDRVIESERRLSGARLGASPPSTTTLTLLAGARRVVAGEVALVGPAGVRVEQATLIQPDGTPSPVLRLSVRDRSVRECRSVGELARHVDLASLTPDSPPQAPASS